MISFGCETNGKYYYELAGHLSFGLGIGTAIAAQPTDIYARNIPNAVCVAPPEDEQVMLETCRGP
jgi:hypothetical protein